MSNQIRPLFSSDSLEINELRQSVIKSDPMSFSITLAEDTSHKEQDGFLSQFLQRPDTLLLGCIVKEKLVGMVGAERCLGVLKMHKARIFGLYVDHPYRNQGIGKKLLEEALVIVQSWNAVEKIILETTSESHSALFLYKKFGFIQTKCEENALKFTDKYVSDIHMELPLSNI